MLWEELLCRESCNLIPVVPVFCVCVFIPGHSGSDSHRSPCLVFPNVVQQRHSADSTQISGAVWLVRVRLTPCLVQGNLGGCTRGGVVTSGLCWIRRVRELPVCVGLTSAESQCQVLLHRCLARPVLELWSMKAPFAYTKAVLLQ